MGLKDFYIEFEKPIPAYFPGEIVNGKLVISLTNEKKMAKIKVVCTGVGYVHWTESKTVSDGTDSNGNSKTKTETETFSATETYFNQEIIPFNGPSLPIGKNEFPFSFTLPNNLASSFETATGHVRYQVKAQIVRDWKWNHRVRRLITVNGILDLNLVPKCKEPGETRNHKRLCCFCCKSGPISAVLHTKRTGYVPGEMIGFNAEIDNQSNRDMRSSKLSLIEHVTYITRSKNKYVSRIVAQTRHGRVSAGDSDLWEGVVMKIPAVPPTNLAGLCNVIKVYYTLELNVVPKGPAFDLKVQLPVTIGTVPLKEFIGTLTAAQTGIEPSAPALFDTLKNSYPDLPPPTYSESVWGVTNVTDKDDKYLEGDSDFQPRYPLYNTTY